MPQLTWRNDINSLNASRSDFESKLVVVKDGDAVHLGANSVGALETPTIPSAPRLARINW